jgi:UvrD-like helicase C-terminal domain
VTFQEEKRLCYVAMTRAKTELVMTWRLEVSAFTNGGIKTFKRNRSRFLDVLTEQKNTGTDKTKTSNNLMTSSSKFNYPIQTSNKSYSTFVGKKDSKTLPTKSQSNISSTKSNIRDNNSRIGDSYSSLPSAFGQRQVSKAAATTSKRSSSTVSKQPRKIDTVNTRQSIPNAVLGRSGTNASTVPKETMELSRKAHVLNQEVHRRNFAKRFEGGDRIVPTLNDQRPVMTKVDGPVTRTNGSRRQVSTRTAKARPKVDSTWFFPIGSRVTHKKLGTGVVLHPKVNDDPDIMLVHVGFSNGEKHEFPVNGSDLSPIVQ